ncbi:MAG: hypothetical protein M1817_001877 [Caeruleum heppii]|nr:MAG: hypothetical protein M1817_001877 [Caeruleum heppii]
MKSSWPCTRLPQEPELLVLQPRASTCEKCPRKCQKGYVRNQQTCKCIKVGNDSESKDKEKQGKCPSGQVLDPAEGGQDASTANPKCIADDASKCGQGEVPESRPKKDGGGPKDTVDCAKDLKEEDKPKCTKSEYRFIEIQHSVDGKTAKYSCQKTRDWDRRKDSKFEETKARKKAEYEKRKAERDRERQEREERERQDRERRDKEKAERKKKRLGKCLTIVPLAMDGDSMAFSDEFFDEDFVSSDEMLQYWPADIPDVDETVNLDSDEFLEGWIGPISNSDWLLTPMTPFKRRSLQDDAADEIQSPHEKRFIPGIIGAILGFIGRAAPVITRFGATAGSRLAGATARLAKAGRSSQSLSKMKDAASKVSKDKNWQRCLKGKGPE